MEKIFDSCVSFVKSIFNVRQAVAVFLLFLAFQLLIKNGVLGSFFAAPPSAKEDAGDSSNEKIRSLESEMKKMVTRDEFPLLLKTDQTTETLKRQDRDLVIELRNLVDKIKLSRSAKKEVQKSLSDLEKNFAANSNQPSPASPYGPQHEKFLRDGNAEVRGSFEPRAPSANRTIKNKRSIAPASVHSEKPD